VPVTIKVRKGIDDSLLTYLDAGRVAESEGAAAIGLHARTAAQLYSGDADWDAVAALKNTVRIPVLGNGDVWECWDALRMMRRTGCDGVIVGRGCLRRPWLFRELAQVFDGCEPDPQPNLGTIIALMHRHAALLVEFFGEHNGMRQMRKWCAWYTSGFQHSAQARADLMRIGTIAEMTAILARLDPDEAFPLKDRAAQPREGQPDAARDAAARLSWRRATTTRRPPSRTIRRAPCVGARAGRRDRKIDC
jgi:nifR3 family TIM-barrel protein